MTVGGTQINNGVYRSGFATTQAAYARAQADLYAALDTVEARLSQHRFLVGDRCAIALPCHGAVQMLLSCLVEHKSLVLLLAGSCGCSLCMWCVRISLGIGGLHRFTEADLRLYPTIIRFDGAYATLFKCCRRRVADYPHLSAWLRDVYQLQTPAPSALQARPLRAGNTAAFLDSQAGVRLA